ncbi:bifunctional sulfate adenylyltransferase subunit 1/adenylylsulfate kinase, partial [Klebsiella pneumoniae]
DEVDCSRGDVIATADNPPQVADQFQATIVWMAETPLLPGRSYWLKLGTQTVSATVQEPRHAIDVNTLAELSVRTLALNDIGVAEVYTDRDLV